MYGIDQLNEIQKQAVLDTEGAVLVTAGAGSGKTRLLTHRIAHLIKDLRVPPYNILAITFTNKAADEMRSRLEGMLGDTDGIWIFTFHAACVRILRRFIHLIGYDKNFTIYGEAETKAVVKRICKDRAYNEDMVKRILAEISDCKNKGIAPEEYSSTHPYAQDGDSIENAFLQYQATLKANNALDYDDLLVLTLKLLRESATAREFFSDKFRYIHIDEFQDTNTVQYEIAKLLAAKHGNIFAVGDEDQCIYTWRGASIENIFAFQKDFACKVYKLEQNYRSTGNILAVANRIIKGNTQRLDKRLWTENDGGNKVVCFAAATDGYEADYVVRTLYELIREVGYNYSDCAVLMRLNALTRPFEERFMQYGIPHRIYGGYKFYDRKEIKDVLAYARLSVNPRDDEAIYRIINFPRRGIGEASVEKIREIAQSTGKSAFDIITHAQSHSFPTALRSKLAELGATLEKLCAAAQGGITSYFKYLLFEVLNVVDLFSENDEDGARLENINELVNSVHEFSKNNPDAALFDYLQTVSLYSETDDMNGDNAVTVATVHSAKGLEFPVVFVVGLEDGTFPSLRMNENEAAHMEEERRLMYVAVTRAMKRLYLTYAKSRYLYGETRYNIASRFLTEAGLVERKANPADRYTSSPSYGAARSVTSGGYGGYSDGKQGGHRSSGYSAASKPAAVEHSDKSLFTPGAIVMHKRLGKGTVLSVENVGKNLYAKIEFERGGVMNLAVDFAPLTVIKG